MTHPNFAKAATHITADNVRECLMDLVDIASPTGKEIGVAQYLVERMRKSGLDTHLPLVDEGRPNAVGHLRGRGDGLNLLFTGHMDTSYSGDEAHLAAEGFKPKPVFRDGWIYGLGANNMKSGLASSLVAIEAIVKAGITLGGGDISFGGVVGDREDRGRGIPGHRIFRLRHRHPASRDARRHGRFRAARRAHDFADIDRQHGCHLAAHQRRRNGGAFRLGAPAGNGERDRGDARLAKRSRAMGEGLRSVKHFYGRATQCDGRGHPWRRAMAAVAQSARVQPLPSTSAPCRARPRTASSAICGVCCARSGRERVFPSRRCTFTSPIRPWCWMRSCRSSRRWVRREKDVTGSSPAPIIRRPGADAVHLTAYGVPCVAFGPGGRLHPDSKGAAMHAVGEHVFVDDCVQAAKIYLALALDLCNRKAPN